MTNPTIVITETALPKLIGENEEKRWVGIALTEWVNAVEASFKNDNLTEEAEKINRAKSCVNYEEGNIAKILSACYFSTWVDLKETLLKITFRKGKQPIDDFIEIKNMKYNKKTNLSTFCYEILSRVKKSG